MMPINGRGELIERGVEFFYLGGNVAIIFMCLAIVNQ